jgi:hypothetical protein
MPFVISKVTSTVTAAVISATPAMQVSIPIDYVIPIVQETQVPNTRENYCFYTDRLKLDYRTKSNYMEVVCEPRAIYNRTVVGFYAYYTYRGKQEMIVLKDKPGPTILLNTQ